VPQAILLRLALLEHSSATSRSPRVTEERLEGAVRRDDEVAVLRSDDLVELQKVDQRQRQDHGGRTESGWGCPRANPLSYVPPHSLCRLAAAPCPSSLYPPSMYPKALFQQATPKRMGRSRLGHSYQPPTVLVLAGVTSVSRSTPPFAARRRKIRPSRLRSGLELPPPRTKRSRSSNNKAKPRNRLAVVIQRGRQEGAGGPQKVIREQAADVAYGGTGLPR
jgi:hypothetical protein